MFACPDASADQGDCIVPGDAYVRNSGGDAGFHGAARPQLALLRRNLRGLSHRLSRVSCRGSGRMRRQGVEKTRGEPARGSDNRDRGSRDRRRRSALLPLSVYRADRRGAVRRAARMAAARRDRALFRRDPSILPRASLGSRVCARARTKLRDGRSLGSGGADAGMGVGHEDRGREAHRGARRDGGGGSGRARNRASRGSVFPAGERA